MELVDSIVDPNIVRLLNDYRRVKAVVSLKAKSLSVRLLPSKKAVPTKKGEVTPASSEAGQHAEQMTEGKGLP